MCKRMQMFFILITVCISKTFVNNYGDPKAFLSMNVLIHICVIMWKNYIIGIWKQV